MNLSSLIFVFVFIYRIYSCPLTDEYLSRCHCEILTNGESLIQCEEHSLEQIPLFKRSFPYDELRLINNRIAYLPGNAFDLIKTIRRINLHGNSLSLIDDHLLHLAGNYLEELILSGDDHIQSLEFLTRYPLKNLRVLKLDRFNLSTIDLNRIFANLTKLEIVSLDSCQLTVIPHLPSIDKLSLQRNLLSNTTFLSTNHQELNLANNRISSIILQNNERLIALNLSNNLLNDFYSSTISNKHLRTLDLSVNQLSSIDWTISSENLTSLNLSSNRLEKINFNSLPQSLRSLDLHSNQLKTLEQNSLIEQLNFFDLKDNPFDCNCQIKWLSKLMKQFNQSTWNCSTSDFLCQIMPRVISFNVTYVSTSISETGLLVQWMILDQAQSIDYLQISLEQPFRQSEKILPDQTEIFISKNLSPNRIYHVCLIIRHKYARDKYCRDILTKEPISIASRKSSNNEIFFHEDTSIENKSSSDQHFIYLFIGSCIGGFLTLILLLTCCYLCYRIHRYQRTNTRPIYEKCSQHYPYPICHSPHQMIYNNSENLSHSTDSTTTSCTTKHIYQTIDCPDYCSLNRQNQQLFHLWKDSIRQKR